MKKLLFPFIIGISLFFSCNSPMSIYVSPSGANNNEGTIDSPVKDLANAIDLALEIKNKNPQKNIQIILVEGEYHLDKTISISPKLNGLEISSEKGNAIIKGSKTVHPDWQVYNDEIMVTQLETGLSFEQLFVNGKQQILAVIPITTKTEGTGRDMPQMPFQKSELKHGAIQKELFFMPCTVANGAIFIIKLQASTKMEKPFWKEVIRTTAHRNLIQSTGWLKTFLKNWTVPANGSMI